MNIHYNKQGKKIDLLTWAKLLEKKGYKRVAETTLKNGKYISTIWLGLDHNFFIGGPPLMFETMVFESKHKRRKILGKLGDDLSTIRYSTLKQAKAGHKKAVNEWKGKKTT